MGVSGGPNIVRDSSLVLEIDPLDRNSIISGSNNVYNLAPIGGSGSWNIPQSTAYSSSYLGINNPGNSLSKISTFTGSIFPQNSGSISIWFNMPQYYQAFGAPFFDDYDNARDHFFIRHVSYATLQIAAQDTINLSTYEGVFIDNSLQINNWYNIVFTYVTGNSSSFKYYINGELKGTTTFLSSSWRPGDQTVAYGNPNANKIATGSYGPLSIYSRDLSQQEIQQNYNALKSRFNL
jgi:hypothetical protein